MHITRILLLLFITLISSLVYANEISTQNKHLCKVILKACQTDSGYKVGELKKQTWDPANKAYPFESLRLFRDHYFEYLYCQHKYNSCINNQPSDFHAYQQLISKTPDTPWPNSTPDKESIDSATINNVVENASKIKHLRSLLIAKNGKLVSESYFQFKDDLRPQWIMSTTKSIVSLLIGIAIDQGYISSVEDSITPYFSDYFATRDSSLKKQIRIIDLLSMKSGLDSSDISHWWSDAGASNLDEYWAADNAHDYGLKFQLAYIPGSTYQYSTVAVDLLTSILKSATGMPVNKFAEKYLFTPLGIKNYQWAHDSNIYHRGGYVLFLRPRDMAMIGQLILDDGLHNNKQLISKNWLNQSFHIHQHNVWPTLFSSTGTTLDYGYLWYITKINNYDIFLSYGYGGNHIIMIPEKDLLIVTTANYDLSIEDAVLTPDLIFKDIVHVIVNSF